MCTHRYAFFCSFHVFCASVATFDVKFVWKMNTDPFCFWRRNGQRICNNGNRQRDQNRKWIIKENQSYESIYYEMTVWAVSKVSKLYISCFYSFCARYFFFIIIICFFGFFFFSFCLRRASSITWASQTPNQWLIDCPSSRHGHTSVSLTATKKKQEYKLGFTVWWRAKEQIIDNHDTNLSLILKKTLFYCLPWFPIVPCLVSVDIGME